MPYTIPAKTALTLVVDALWQRAERIDKRARQNPRRAAASTQAGRETQSQRLRDHAKALQALMPRSGEVDAATAGLLAALASGWQDALVQLEEIEPRLEAIRSWQIVEICRILLG